jgi:hypothetical protein
MDLMVIDFFKLHKYHFIKLKYNMKNIKIIGLKEMKLKFKYFQLLNDYTKTN